MGSPYICYTSSRLHAVTTVRGAAMILNKILRSARIFGVVPGSDEILELLTDLHTVALQGVDVQRGVDLIWERDIHYHAAQIIHSFCSAFTLSIVQRRSVSATYTAGYQWKGHEKFDCTVFFNMTAKERLVRRADLSQTPSRGGREEGI